MGTIQKNFKIWREINKEYTLRASRTPQNISNPLVYFRLFFLPPSNAYKYLVWKEFALALFS